MNKRLPLCSSLLTFVSVHVILLVLLLVFSMPGSAFSAIEQEDALKSSFMNPGLETRPQTLWFWMNGNVSEQGVKLDLESMAKVGLGGALIFDGGDYFPEGPARYLSQTWQDRMQQSIVEADRLNMTIGMHNAPGWSSSGGPWITPELSMKQLVWTETTVQESHVAGVILPRPQANLGFYRDAYVFAFPAQAGESVAFRDRIRRVGTSEGKGVSVKTLTDGLLDTAVDLGKDSFLEIELNESETLCGITLNSTLHGSFPRFRLQASEDGVHFHEVTQVQSVGTHSIRAPASLNFPPTQARFFRLIPQGKADLAEVELHAYPRVYDWVRKSNLAYNLGNQVRIPEAEDIIPGIDPETVINLSEKLQPDGTLNWRVPEGAWTVVRLGYTSTGKHNVTASASGDGLECDKFDPAAIEFHFHHVVGTVLENAGELAGKSFKRIEVDSYEAGMQNWTANFPAEFQTRAGYDIVPYLPALTGRIVGDSAVTERFFYDFQRTQADLMTEAYYGRLKTLCHAHGLDFYIEGYGQGMFDELEVSGLADFPMTEFWTRTPWTPNRTVKMVASAAHVYGKPVVAAESFTGEERTSRWLSYPYALKALGDTMYSWGLNQMFFHRFAHQPHPTAVPGMAMGLWGFQFERTNPWFKDSSAWLAYLTRCQSVLRQGNYVADILYFIGERPPDVAQWALPLIPDGYTYDLVNADVILHRLDAHDGKMVLPEGGSYSVLVLPEDLQGMTQELVEKLETFAAKGVRIVGPKPKHVLSLKGYPESEQKLQTSVDAIWNREHVMPSAALDEVLIASGMSPDFTYRGQAIDASLSWCHRRFEDSDIYFIANRQRRMDALLCTFRVSGKRPELWFPETGEIRDVPVYEELGDRIQMPLTLSPSESVFVVFRDRGATHPVRQVLKNGEVLISSKLPAEPPEKAAEPAQTFSMSVWAKPDIELRLFPEESIEGFLDETGKFYAIPAAEGDILFGEHHAIAGVAVGRNGVFVVERSSGEAPAVLSAPMPVSGWTHVAVVYQEGTPSLYVNGVFVKEGLRSGKTVHPGIGSPMPAPETIFHFRPLDHLAASAGKTAPPSNGRVFFHEGNLTEPELTAEALSPEQILATFRAGIPAPTQPGAIELLQQTETDVTARVWESGEYQLDDAEAVIVDVLDAHPIADSWEVHFPEKSGAPESIRLDSLESLDLNPIPGVKYFGGTATYLQTFQLSPPATKAPNRVVIDLGRVEVIARVWINGKEAGLLWKEPYRVDITDLVQAGENTLKIEVTTLLVNRLIGDEQLPAEVQFGYTASGGTDAYSLNSATGSGVRKFPEWYAKGEPKPDGGRITFSSWGFYTADEPLVASGLLGPVKVYHPVDVNLPR